MKSVGIKKHIKISLYSLLMILLCMVFSPSANAYTLTGEKISGMLVFTPHANFGTTTISHFNEALYQWNTNAGRSLMSRDPVNRHYKTNYPKYDGMNAIYRVNANADYLAQTTWWHHSGTNIVSEADINLNMYYPFANSAQPGKYDTWSVFIHEAGHVAGLNHSEYTEAIMAPRLGDGITKRYLSWDDTAGISVIY